MTEAVRSIIDKLAERVDFSSEAAATRRFMMHVCEQMPLADEIFQELLAVGRECLSGACRPEVLADARRLAVKERDRYARTAPEIAAGFRAVRYLLELPIAPPPDGFEMIWNFVAVAESAGVEDHQLAKLLEEAFGHVDNGMLDPG